MEAKELNGFSKGKWCWNGMNGKYSRKAAQKCGNLV